MTATPRIVGRLAILALAAGVATACGRKPSAHVEIAIESLSYLPDPITVSVGDTVIWLNRDLVPHTASSVGALPGFDSGLIRSGDRFEAFMSAAGVFDYGCAYHPTMSGSIIVEAR